MRKLAFCAVFSACYFGGGLAFASTPSEIIMRTNSVQEVGPVQLRRRFNGSSSQCPFSLAQFERAQAKRIQLDAASIPDFTSELFLFSAGNLFGGRLHRIQAFTYEAYTFSIIYPSKIAATEGLRRLEVLWRSKDMVVRRLGADDDGFGADNRVETGTNLGVHLKPELEIVVDSEHHAFLGQVDGSWAVVSRCGVLSSP
jgi:hypothetical protein